MLRPISLSAVFLATLLALMAGLAKATEERSILIFGDSLSNAHGIGISDSWPVLLQQRLRENRQAIRVINESRKGETSEGGLKRLEAILEKHRPNWVMLELGANDGLQKRPLEELKKNLVQMLEMIRTRGATPILVAMELPPTYEPGYAEGFSAVFAETARETGTALVPFLLRNIVEHPDLFQADHLHPSAEAQPKLLDVVWPVIDPLVTRR